MDNFQKIQNMDLWYIPVIALIVILGLGILIGAFNGWKTALYFFGWNLIFTILAVFIIGAIYSSSIKPIFRRFVSDKVDFSDSTINQIAELFKSAFILLALLIILLFVDLIALIVYIFIRKHLKKGPATLSSRAIGSGLGVLSAIPFTAAVVGLSTAVTNNTRVNKFSNGFAQTGSLGQAKHISEDFDAIYALIGSASVAAYLADIFSGSLAGAPHDPEIKEKIVEALPSVVNMINNPKSSALAASIIKEQVEQNGQDVDFATDKDEIIASINDYGLAAVSGISSSGKNQLISILSGLTDKTDDATRTAIEDIVNSVVTQ